MQTKFVFALFLTPSGGRDVEMGGGISPFGILENKLLQSSNVRRFPGVIYASRASLLALLVAGNSPSFASKT